MDGFDHGQGDVAPVKEQMVGSDQHPEALVPKSVVPSHEMNPKSDKGQEDPKPKASSQELMAPKIEKMCDQSDKLDTGLTEEFSNLSLADPAQKPALESQPCDVTGGGETSSSKPDNVQEELTNLAKQSEQVVAADIEEAACLRSKFYPTESPPLVLEHVKHVSPEEQTKATAKPKAKAKANGRGRGRGAKAKGRGRGRGSKASKAKSGDHESQDEESRDEESQDEESEEEEVDEDQVEEEKVEDAKCKKPSKAKKGTPKAKAKSAASRKRKGEDMDANASTVKKSQKSKGKKPEGKKDEDTEKPRSRKAKDQNAKANVADEKGKEEKSTKSGKRKAEVDEDPEKLAACKKASRKSSAYHVAMRSALQSGLSESEAKVKAKEASKLKLNSVYTQAFSKHMICGNIF